jgi:hypothetical protein
VTDRTIRNDHGEFADNRGNVYDIEGDHVEENPVPNPRDSIGTGPAAGYMGGGAGGIATSGFDTSADMEDSELRAASESGLHGSVAEAADLGQRPLRDYKIDADPVEEPTMSADQSSAGVVSSYVSDADAVDRSGTAAVPVESRTTTGRTASDSDAHGRVILDTSEDRFDESGSTAGGVSDTVVNQTVETTTVGTQPAASTPFETGSTNRDSISLDTDNTSPIGDISSTETLDNVQIGYRVIDGNGDEIGTIRDLKAGDTSAATVDDASEGQGESEVLAVPGGFGSGGSGSLGAGGGLPAVVGFGTGDGGGGGGGEPNVSEPAYTRLLRTGFIKIDSKGWFASDRYAGADQIDRVEGDTVYLRVGKDQLIS